MISRIHVINNALYTLAAAIFVAIAVFIFLLITPIDVLSNWHVVAPEGSFKVGDTIVVQSLFTKKRNVDGMSHRSLLCDNATGSEVAYPVNDAVANHAAQAKAGVGILVTIPPIVAPATCKLAISIEYKVYPFRTVTEFATSNTFKVIK